MRPRGHPGRSNHPYPEDTPFRIRSHAKKGPAQRPCPEHPHLLRISFELADQAEPDARGGETAGLSDRREGLQFSIGRGADI